MEKLKKKKPRIKNLDKNDSNSKWSADLLNRSTIQNRGNSLALSKKSSELSMSQSKKLSARSLNNSKGSTSMDDVPTPPKTSRIIRESKHSFNRGRKNIKSISINEVSPDFKENNDESIKNEKKISQLLRSTMAEDAEIIQDTFDIPSTTSKITMIPDDFDNWNIDQVAEWAKENGLDVLANRAILEDIDGNVLANSSADELKEFGLDPILFKKN